MLCTFAALTAILRGLSPHFMAVDTEAQREQGALSVIESCHFLLAECDSSVLV